MFENTLCKYIYCIHCKIKAKWRLLFKNKIKNKNPNVQFTNAN